ncbi:MAG TPA: hypothetical protein VF069_14650 [Streptosporangiaceae bacterium]
MPFPTDRGYAALSTKPDGTTTVMIATGVKAGELVNVFAKHVGVDNVRLGPGVRLRQGSAYRYTDQVVEVSPADGVLHVRLPDSRFGLPVS